MHRQHLPPTHLFSLRLIFHFSLRSVEICSIFVSTSRQRAGEPSRSSINRQMTLTFSEGLRHCSGCVASVERIWRERERRERGGREREGRKEGEKKRRRRRNRSMVCWCGQRVHVKKHQSLTLSLTHTPYFTLLPLPPPPPHMVHSSRLPLPEVESQQLRDSVSFHLHITH